MLAIRVRGGMRYRSRSGSASKQGKKCVSWCCLAPFQILPERTNCFGHILTVWLYCNKCLEVTIRFLSIAAALCPNFIIFICTTKRPNYCHQMRFWTGKRREKFVFGQKIEGLTMTTEKVARKLRINWRPWNCEWPCPCSKNPLCSERVMIWVMYRTPVFSLCLKVFYLFVRCFCVRLCVCLLLLWSVLPE